MPIEDGQQLLETPAANGAAMLEPHPGNELRSRRWSRIWSPRPASSRRPQVPEELFDHYTQLISNQVAEELAGEIIKTLHKQIRPEHLPQPEFVSEKLAEQLEKLLPTAGPIVRTKTHGPHVVALIGPTGVGKTTTLAKLAANLKLREKHRVGLITLDTYRIAAVDQLKRYADIIGSPLRVVNGAEDLRDAIAVDERLRFRPDRHRRPQPQRRAEAQRAARACSTRPNPDEVHWCSPPPPARSACELAISRFGDVRVDKIIFTKLDEAAHVGVVLNVVRKVNKSALVCHDRAGRAGRHRSGQGQATGAVDSWERI